MKLHFYKVDKHVSLPSCFDILIYYDFLLGPKWPLFQLKIEKKNRFWNFIFVLFRLQNSLTNKSKHLAASICYHSNFFIASASAELNMNYDRALNQAFLINLFEIFFFFALKIDCFHCSKINYRRCQCHDTKQPKKKKYYLLLTI